MKKLTLFFSICLFSFVLTAQKAVQVLGTDKQVSLSVFKDLQGVYQTIDNNQIYRYYIDISSEADAADVISKANAAGFSNAFYRDLGILPPCCNVYTPPPPPPVVDTKIRTLKSIFFDFDKSFLRPASKAELQTLLDILRENPSYKAGLRAHTDAKGSIEYNRALSQRRVDSAKNYLLSRGIDASRISTSTYGEDSPIAKNEKNGADTPEGRQLNRRVELLVLDASGSILNGVVEDIYVPDGLRN